MRPARIDPVAEAKQEFADELHRRAVDAYLAKLRAEAGLSLWQRLISKIPFTITITRKPK